MNGIIGQINEVTYLLDWRDQTEWSLIPVQLEAEGLVL
jgi:hypothetical protein